MIDTILNHPLIDDVKAIDVETYMAQKPRLASAERDALVSYRTMLVLSISYPHEAVAWNGKGYGLVSRYAYGLDYHRVFDSAFEDIEKTLKTKGIKAKGYADISPFDERFVAALANTGYIGKNQFLIHPRFGTYHYLGILLVDAALSTKGYLSDDCGDCTRCIEACPTGALDAGFDERLCSSYVTQMKAPLTDADITPLKTMVYGCDICQRVCPKNADRTFVPRPHFMADEHAQLNLENLLALSNKAIEKTFRTYAFVWRGGLVLKRNAMALLLNQGMRESLPLMRDVASRYAHVPWFHADATRIISKLEELP